MSGDRSKQPVDRVAILTGITSIRVETGKPLRHVQVPDETYRLAEKFVVEAPNVLDQNLSYRFKILYHMPSGRSIYDLMIDDARNVRLNEAKAKIFGWREASKSLLRYALNLLLAPKRPEFQRLKLSSSYYVYQVAKKLGGAEEILQAMGYKRVDGGSQEVQELKYDGDVDSKRVAETAADLVILDGELVKIGHLVGSFANHRNLTLSHILLARAHPTDLYTKMKFILDDWALRGVPPNAPEVLQYSTGGYCYTPQHQQPQHNPPQEQLMTPDISKEGQQPSSMQPSAPTPQSSSDHPRRGSAPAVSKLAAPSGYPDRRSRNDPSRFYENLPLDPDVVQERKEKQAAEQPQHAGLPQVSGSSHQYMNYPKRNRPQVDDYEYIYIPSAHGETERSQIPPDPFNLPEPIVQNEAELARLQAFTSEDDDFDPSSIINARSDPIGFSGPNFDSLISYQSPEHAPSFNKAAEDAWRVDTSPAEQRGAGSSESRDISGKKLTNMKPESSTAGKPNYVNSEWLDQQQQVDARGDYDNQVERCWQQAKPTVTTSSVPGSGSCEQVLPHGANLPAEKLMPSNTSNDDDYEYGDVWLKAYNSSANASSSTSKPESANTAKGRDYVNQKWLDEKASACGAYESQVERHRQPDKPLTTSSSDLGGRNSEPVRQVQPHRATIPTEKSEPLKTNNEEDYASSSDLLKKEYHSTANASSTANKPKSSNTDKGHDYENEKWLEENANVLDNFENQNLQPSKDFKQYTKPAPDMKQKQLMTQISVEKNIDQTVSNESSEVQHGQYVPIDSSMQSSQTAAQSQPESQHFVRDSQHAPSDVNKKPVPKPRKGGLPSDSRSRPKSYPILSREESIETTEPSIYTKSYTSPLSSLESTEHSEHGSLSFDVTNSTLQSTTCTNSNVELEEKSVDSSLGSFVSVDIKTRGTTSTTPSVTCTSTTQEQGNTSSTSSAAFTRISPPDSLPNEPRPRSKVISQRSTDSPTAFSPSRTRSRLPRHQSVENDYVVLETCGISITKKEQDPKERERAISKQHISSMSDNRLYQNPAEAPVGSRDRSCTSTSLDNRPELRGEYRPAPSQQSVRSPKPTPQTQTPVDAVVQGTWTCSYCTNMVFEGQFCDVCGTPKTSNTGTLV